MNWFTGNIAEAVALSKSKNSIFVVYCEGNDEVSAAFTLLLNNEHIRSKLESDDFVSIKIQSDSEAYIQFAQIYKLVPLPSLFFIGKNGTPIEIVTGITKTVDELDNKIDSVLNKWRPTPTASASNASADLIASESSQSNPTDDMEIVCENGVCYKRPKQTATTNENVAIDSTSQSNSSQLSNDEKLKRAKDLIEKKRLAKEEEDARLAKERELQRRRVGQDLQSFKQRQEENEMKKLQEERKRDKIEEQAARKRILEQIALDKAERAQRFSAINPSSSSSSTTSTSTSNETSNPSSNPLPSVVSDSTIARIQFKKPDGEVDVKTFGRDELFTAVRLYVEENVIVGSVIREFALATTFPRHEFNAADNEKTLIELGLVPSAVILVLPLDKAPSRKLPLERNYGFIAMLTTIFWGIVNPVLAAFSFAKNKFFSWKRGDTGAAKRANEDSLNYNEQAKKRILRFDKQQPSTSSAESNKMNSGPHKRAGATGSNIHRLSDKKDSDDENNTWNGNSTQQQ